jgi:hypothetical protein
MLLKRMCALQMLDGILCLCLWVPVFLYIIQVHCLFTDILPGLSNHCSKRLSTSPFNFVNGYFAYLGTYNVGHIDISIILSSLSFYNTLLLSFWNFFLNVYFDRCKYSGACSLLVYIFTFNLYMSGKLKGICWKQQYIFVSSFCYHLDSLCFE